MTPRAAPLSHAKMDSSSLCLETIGGDHLNMGNIGRDIPIAEKEKLSPLGLVESFPQNNFAHVGSIQYLSSNILIMRFPRGLDSG